MLRDTFLPVDWFWQGLRCDNCGATVSVLLGLQCLKASIGLLEDCVHLLSGPFVGLNLCKHEVFLHFEKGLGQEEFLYRNLASVGFLQI